VSSEDETSPGEQELLALEQFRDAFDDVSDAGV